MLGAANRPEPLESGRNRPAGQDVFAIAQAMPGVAHLQVCRQAERWAGRWAAD